MTVTESGAGGVPGPPEGTGPPGLTKPSAITFVAEYVLPAHADYQRDAVWAVISAQFAADAAAAGVTPGMPMITNVRIEQPLGNFVFVTLSG